MVHSHRIEYAAPVFSIQDWRRRNTIPSNINKRERFGILAGQYITYNNAMSALNAKSQLEKLNELTLKFGKNLMSSTNRRSLLQPFLREVHDKDTRWGRALLQAVRCHTCRYKHSTTTYIVNTHNQTA